MPKRYNARKLITSFVSTLGVGSTWTGSAVDVSEYTEIVGLFHAASSNVVVGFDQSGVNSPWSVSSPSGAIAAGVTAPVSWQLFGQYGRAVISTVNSSVAGDIMRLHVYGVPI